MARERSIDSEEFVEELTNDAIHRPDTNYIFFLGAGCSKESGIPLAGELAKQWADQIIQSGGTKKEKLLNDISYMEETAQQHYFKVFELLFPTLVDQQKEIKRICRDA